MAGNNPTHDYAFVVDWRVKINALYYFNFSCTDPASWAILNRKSMKPDANALITTL